MRRRALLVPSAVLVLLMLGCPAPRNVLLVAIPQGGQVMTLGQSVYLTADVVTTGGAPTTVTWESDDVSVATVTGAGLVNAVGLGSTFVIATSVADNAMSAEVSITVLPISTRSLAVSRSGGGFGSVTSDPAGIDCGDACFAEFDDGVSITLTAQPLQGSVFMGWSGACSGSATTCTLQMTQARSVTTTFDVAPAALHSLSVSRSGSGSGTVTSSPDGIDCGSLCSHDFAEDLTVTVTAVPAAGSEHAGWSGCDATSGAQCTVSMTGARTVTATFNVPPPPDQETLAVSRLGSGSGTVTSSPDGVDCGSTCTAVFDIGTSVTLSASPASGSTFAGWSGACSGTGTCSVSMTQARSVTATFNLAPQSQSITITVSVLPSGVAANGIGGSLRSGS